MRRVLSLFVAAALLAVPGLSSAQEKAGVTLTPYGFLLLNTFWSAGPMATPDSAYSARLPAAGGEGGAFLMAARASRIGFRLSNLDTGFLGATASGVLEGDFIGGYLPNAQPTAWQAPLFRLRLANVALDWKTHYGNWSVLLGQDYGLMGPVFAYTLAYPPFPVFTQSGKIFRRTPQARLTYSRQMGAFGLQLAGAALNPAVLAPDATPVVNFGPGNKSRVPDLEARLGLTAEVAKDMNAAVNFAYLSGWRRYYYDPATGPSHMDKRATIFGVSLVTNVTKFFEFRGEWYQNKGAEDGENGGFPGVVGAASPATLTLLKTTGWWFQSILKPIPEVWLAFGHGIAKADAGPQPAGARYQNELNHAMVLLNASKNMKFSAEVASATTYTSAKAQATQYSANAQFLF